MCGIVGFTGHRQAAPVLLDGLAKLEYRGYDSAGLAPMFRATACIPARARWNRKWWAYTTALLKTTPSCAPS